MRLITAHRILIGAAIAFFLFYALFQARRALGAGGTASGVQALLSAVVVVALALYYRSLRGWGRR
ncbi:MAG TPA: hypothetical protein VNK50_14405 [Calidithermus sp.]|nr:hypothetical protein [Calidithermus sp.]